MNTINRNNTVVHFDKNRLFFNKWEMYKLLSSYQVPFHIPFTTVLTRQSLHYFLNSTSPFFIKPVNSWAGKNITLVNPTLNGFILSQPNGNSSFYQNQSLIMQSIERQYAGTHSILQEKAPLTSFNSKVFDIRVHLQRDPSGGWIYAGDLARIGGNKVIVSNLFAQGGGVMETDNVINHILDFNQVNNVKQKLAKSTYTIAKILDSQYPFVDIGADFGLDQQGDLWLLEVNTNDREGRPGYDLFKKLPNKTTYKKMITIDKERKKVWNKTKMFPYLLRG
ncbi:YheC/YheD family protein [Aquibacillus koreensis]|uniref:YheC/YheD family protein n=1 Tax=Aquibacillus koreensis TaxID=279446 RepID=A0A9X3WNC7_9BACI|nr:YheC/YheD family protein [Aquibacillus koreensis]MCT2536951.1 YheC/YheD family protein [Aquibacillus koreensis]MDC3421918.1 YheC/YheD family protein [Aquibacillus koreensis]